MYICCNFIKLDVVIIITKLSQIDFANNLTAKQSGRKTCFERICVRTNSTKMHQNARQVFMKSLVGFDFD